MFSEQFTGMPIGLYKTTVFFYSSVIGMQ